MRLLLRLKCSETSPYEMQYHYHLQGFIYGLLKGSKYDYIHDKEGYKFFCFSNIFPAKSLESNDLRTLIVSSPNNEFIQYLYEKLQKQCNRSITIAHMKFSINSIDKFSVKIPNNIHVTLITGTPIIVRIPREKYLAYGNEQSNNYNYIYWRNDHPFYLFISQLENNLLKKYIEYSKFCDDRYSIPALDTDSASIPPPPIFQKFKFKKQISTRLYMKGFQQVVIGTIWEFGFDLNFDRNLIQFILDSGLGERNSLGFGFMNISH